jgi:sugar (pentulose or hexulose) kinase
MSRIEKDLLLGLDIGTSSIKLVVTDNIKNEIVYELSESTQNARIHTANQLNNEQNVTVILDIVSSLLNQIPIESLMRLKAIQICGQMHGVVLWHSQTRKYSNLVTWQGQNSDLAIRLFLIHMTIAFEDARCTEKFLSSLPVQSKTDLNTGYGNATLFWYSLNEPSTYFDDYDSCGTIQDFVTFL